MKEMLFGCILSLVSTHATAEVSILPPLPALHVLDESTVLSPSTLQALQALVAEHERTTEEKLFLAIFKSLDGNDASEYTRRVYSEWGSAQQAKGNQLLFAHYLKEGVSRIEVGYGLESLLGVPKTESILNDIFEPEMRAGDLDRAVGLTALEILRALESPLFQNNKAQEILRAGGLRGAWEPTQSASGSNGGLVLGFGLVLFLGAIYFISSAEAHYTGSGWYKPRPWEHRPFGQRGPTGNSRDLSGGGAIGRW